MSGFYFLYLFFYAVWVQILYLKLTLRVSITIQLYSITECSVLFTEDGGQAAMKGGYGLSETGFLHACYMLPPHKLMVWYSDSCVE